MQQEFQPFIQWSRSVRYLNAPLLVSHSQRRFTTQQIPSALDPGLCGFPAVTSTACKPGCCHCIEVCPTDAITGGGDRGACITCSQCISVCPEPILTVASPRFADALVVTGPGAEGHARTVACVLRGHGRSQNCHRLRHLCSVRRRSSECLHRGQWCAKHTSCRRLHSRVSTTSVAVDSGPAGRTKTRR